METLKSIYVNSIWILVLIGWGVIFYLTALSVLKLINYIATL